MLPFFLVNTLHLFLLYMDSLVSPMPNSCIQHFTSGDCNMPTQGLVRSDFSKLLFSLGDFLNSITRLAGFLFLFSSAEKLTLTATNRL